MIFNRLSFQLKSNTISAAGRLRTFTSNDYRISSHFVMTSVNRKVRELLAAREAALPGARRHAAAVAVFAVAVGDKVGLDQERLLNLRIAAELSGISVEDDELIKVLAVDDQSRAIIELCERYVSCGLDKTLPESWPDRDDDPALLSALNEVKGIIQPVGSE